MLARPSENSPISNDVISPLQTTTDSYLSLHPDIISIDDKLINWGLLTLYISRLKQKLPNVICINYNANLPRFNRIVYIIRPGRRPLNVQRLQLPSNFDHFACFELFHVASAILLADSKLFILLYAHSYVN